MGEGSRTDVDGWTVVERVIGLVAAREGVDSGDLDVPLIDAIDPDALARLVDSAGAGSTGASLTVTFTYHGYDVLVVADGTVYVRENP